MAMPTVDNLVNYIANLNASWVAYREGRFFCLTRDQPPWPGDTYCNVVGLRYDSPMILKRWILGGDQS